MVATLRAKQTAPDMASAQREADLKGYSFNFNSLALFKRYATQALETSEGRTEDASTASDALSITAEIRNFLRRHDISSLPDLDELMKKLAPRVKQ